METARILVVDEPMHFRAAIDGMLEKEEYATVLSSGVQDAIARIDHDPPYDLILADLAMADGEKRPADAAATTGYSAGSGVAQPRCGGSGGGGAPGRLRLPAEAL